MKREFVLFTAEAGAGGECAALSVDSLSLFGAEANLKVGGGLRLAEVSRCPLALNVEALSTLYRSVEASTVFVVVSAFSVVVKNLFLAFAAENLSRCEKFDLEK